ncbi:ribosome hibernation-promoting factor, HPF/YfiA family [Chloroflexota bacterium]
MELQITGTNMQITPEIKRRVERKLEKLNRHLPNIMESKVEVSEEKTRSARQHYLVRANVSVKGTVFHGEERGEDLFQAIDRLATTLTRQIDHYKGKHWEKDRADSPVRGGSDQATEIVEPARKVVKVKRFSIKPMTVAEAIEQMDLLGHDFFLYFDADKEELKLLYRRNDGDYGLIEPELG